MPNNIEDLIVLPRCLDEVEILRRDADFIIVNKPPRLLTVPGRHPQNNDSVIVRMQKMYPVAAIVHRLDFDTSGILVIPLHKGSLSHISKQFQARTVHKTYTAVVNGLVKDDQGVIDLPIAADMENRPKYKICAVTGKNSVTEFTVLTRNETANTTRILLHPITGRSHQLRLHLQALGHPILGCEFYGDDVTKHKAPRLLLHATELEFKHPKTGKKVVEVCKPDF
jgi:tRNA pseudouridine32 synthase / 23S rRNA pseudouridine746 synthase